MTSGDFILSILTSLIATTLAWLGRRLYTLLHKSCFLKAAERLFKVSSFAHAKGLMASPFTRPEARKFLVAKLIIAILIIAITLIAMLNPPSQHNLVSSQVLDVALLGDNSA